MTGTFKTAATFLGSWALFDVISRYAGSASAAWFAGGFVCAAIVAIWEAGAKRDRDTDGSPAGRDAQRLDGEAATAGAEGIAQTSATIIAEKG